MDGMLHHNNNMNMNMVRSREQIPTQPNEWIYKDLSLNERCFWSRYTHSDESDPDLPECTNEEKEQWEREHPQPEPEPEPEQ